MLRPAGSLCRFCGRKLCRCGEPVRNRKCPRHGDTMKIVSVASWDRGKWKWFEGSQCTECDYARSIKNGQSVPRNENRKTDQLRKKFGAQVRAIVQY